jgi:hypothetical protein
MGMKKSVLLIILCSVVAAPAAANDAAISTFYSPDRLGLSNPVYLSFSGSWDRGENLLVLLDAGVNYQSKFDVSSYWLGGYGVRFADRVGAALSLGGFTTSRGASFVAGPNIRLDLVGPISLRYIGLQPVAKESSSQIRDFTHLVGIQISTVRF